MPEEEMEKFDAIVVGAGPSGVAAAITLARAGCAVVVLERGDFPGAKNLFGGVLFTTVLHELIPEFWKEAPLDRFIVERKLSWLTPDSELGMNLRSACYQDPPHNHMYTVLRARFDRWFAEYAESQGAEIFPGVVVDDFVWKDGTVIGIKARGEAEGEYDELYADVVICAEGANSMLAEKAGLRSNDRMMNAHNRVNAVKEIIKMPKELIESRFGISDKEGVMYEYFGDGVKNTVGSAFIYTNTDSISVGVGATIEDYVENKIAPYDLLDHFKNHPCVAPYLRGGEVVEYSTHMIIEDSYNRLPDFCANGLILVGDSAGLCNSSIYHEITNMAMASGVFAAEAVLSAREKKDFSAAVLEPAYRSRLENSFVLKDMHYARNYIDFLSHNRQFLTEYPNLMVDTALDYFTVDKTPKKDVQKKCFKRIGKEIGWLKLIKDAWKAKKAFLS